MAKIKLLTADEERELAVALMISRERKNSYTNGGDRKYFFGKPDNEIGNTVQKGNSDCSSACRYAIRAATGIDIGYNTHHQLLNLENGVIVDQTNGYYPNEANLKVADLLYFKGNKYHTQNVGHVEMYTGKNECWGHGSGTGPNRHNLRSYCRSRATAEKRYFMAVRWIPDDGKLPQLSLGAKNPSVTAMQLHLLSNGIPLAQFGADGDFGQETLTALQAFQEREGLPVTGVCDQRTWDALMGIQAPVEEIPTVEVEPNPYKQPDFEKNIIAFGAGVGIKGGSESVKWIQWELIDAGFSCGTKGIDGEYGKKTKAAVIAFQESAFPKEPKEWDGKVGKNTGGKLLEVVGSSWREMDK